MEDADESTSLTLMNDLTTRMNGVLQKASLTQTTPESSISPVGIKLDGTNDALWSQVVEMYIAGKDKLGYLNGELVPPPPTDPTFRKLRTENVIVKGWLINSLDPSLMDNFIRFPTAKDVRDSIATTFFRWK